MATTSEKNNQPEMHADQFEQPTLTAQLDRRWALLPRPAAVVCLVAALYLIGNYLPLQSAEVWGEVVYGRWILDQHRLPTEDPLMPLAEGMPIVDSAWLTQVVLAKIASYGDQWLSVLFALTMVATLLTLAGTYYTKCRSGTAGFLTALAVLAGGWMFYTSLKPYHLATLVFALFLAMLAWIERLETGSSGRIRRWAGISGKMAYVTSFVLFVVWANLHSSVVWGLACLLCFLIGQIIEVARSRGALSSVCGDSSVRRRLILLEVALIATLVNPYGIDLLLQIAWFSPRENLADLLGQQPLVLLHSPGREFAISIAVLMVLLRTSQVRIPVAHGLMLSLLALVTIFHQDMFVWYTFVFGFVAAPHFAALGIRFRSSSQAGQLSSGDDKSSDDRPATTWLYTMLGLLAVWVAFALSDASRPLLGGKGRPVESIYGDRAPLALASYLREHPPSENVFNPIGWGDWLALHGPSQFRPFITSHVESLPRQVWRDYGRIVSGRDGWQRLLDRYRIGTVVIDREQQRTLVRTIRTDPDWTLHYQDDQAMVYQRNRGSKSGQ